MWILFYFVQFSVKHALSLKFFLSLQYMYSFSMQISNAIVKNSCVYTSINLCCISGHAWFLFMPDMKGLSGASCNQIVRLLVILSNQHIKCNIYTVQPTYKVQYLR